jgi:hypothetical protein
MKGLGSFKPFLMTDAGISVHLFYSFVIRCFDYANFNWNMRALGV